MSTKERMRAVFGKGVGYAAGLYGLYIVGVIVWVTFRAISQAIGPVSVL